MPKKKGTQKKTDGPLGNVHYGSEGYEKIEGKIIPSNTHVIKKLYQSRNRRKKSNKRR